MTTVTGARAQARADRKGTRKKKTGLAPSEVQASPFTYLMLTLIILISAFPLYFAFVLGSSTNTELANPTPSVVPKSNFFSNIQDALDPNKAENVRLLHSLWNSFQVATIVTIATLFFCSLAGFAFAKLQFKGRNGLFVFLLGTMMIPSQVGLVALYILMLKMPSWLGGNWNGSLKAVIVPSLVSAFGVFLMRQYIQDAIPDELIEAARVDGASTLRVYWNVVVPAIRPVAGVLGLFTFIGMWNDFQWPLITLKSNDQSYTIQVALTNLATGVDINYARLMAASVLAIIPLLLIFLAAGKQIVGGIMEGAVKS